ncbi:ABC transporter ATP-binding protein [Clostridium sp. MSJ-11]|uniref:Spermidine/putrescine import ATP-binding protein PotA n=1 Tax=Clostridium mobile TaxID=2841512 RepID=A0ABS6EN73_9CLOT|nr:spermidine/putrescine ABC transporter ATP-binding protein [Clostridium mobile]MBU5485845.1 ABC transporter ATP-binding protein [Clostridium mobile]
MHEKIIRLSQISKDYDGQTVLDNIDLYICRNEFLTLLGPSGCGKTTTLRIIGGFESPTSGEVLFEGENITNLPPYKRKVNTVFQKYALFTHMNVYENIAFGLKIKKLSKTEIDKKVKEMLELVNLVGFERRSIDSLSGGQQQRIAIARALVNEPEVLLLDEPLGALDLKLRKDMQLELKNIQQRLGITFVFVTHDQEEALTMSDTIVVMNEGKIQQIGTPVDIYNEPKNAFVADFIGESNIVDGVMVKDCFVEFAGHGFVCVDKGFEPNENIDVVIRPEDIKLVDVSEGMIEGEVQSVIFKGVHYEMAVMAKGIKWLVHSTTMEPVNTKVGMKIIPSDIHIMKKVSR